MLFIIIKNKNKTLSRKRGECCCVSGIVAGKNSCIMVINIQSYDQKDIYCHNR